MRITLVPVALASLLLLPAQPARAERPAKAPRTAPRRGECDRDRQCRLDTSSSCCSRCAGEPQAVPLSHQPPACGCALKEDGLGGPLGDPCPAVEPASAFRAVCRAHRCQLKRTTPRR